MANVSRQPKYQIVEDYLREQIEAGEFTIGSTLPTEGALCEQFGVSRATVRTALANIQADGLITRSPAIGSRVIASAPRQEFSTGWGSFEDLLQYARDARMKIHSQEKMIVDSNLHDLTEFSQGRRLIRVSGARITQGMTSPTCLLSVYFDALYGGILDYIEDADKPIAALIEEHYRIRIMSIRQEISADILSEESAAALQERPGGAALVIRRWYYNTEDKLFEMSHAIYPAKQLRYSMTLGRSHN